MSSIPLGALGTWTLCGIWAVKWHHSLLREVIHTHGLRRCVAAYVCAGCHTQMKTEQCILALRQSWFLSCIFWGYVFFYSMAFLLVFLFLTTIHPYESPQGKVKCLADGVSAKTLRLWVVRGGKCVLSLSLVAEAIPICHDWAANLVSYDRPQTLSFICCGGAKVRSGMRLNPGASRRGICGKSRPQGLVTKWQERIWPLDHYKLCWQLHEPCLAVGWSMWKWVWTLPLTSQPYLPRAW